ncbi:MAG: pyridoxal phosphate-dependent aminotransferase [Bacteroidota bacterium]
MRQRLLNEGALRLEYEIREIVKKGRQLEAIGREIYWENIGDPIQKRAVVPEWIKEIVADLVHDDTTYGYCDSKGVLETRNFLAERTNADGGVTITAEDILFFNGLGDAIAKLYQFLPPSSRIIGPSPAYSTHSSSEAAHANSEPLTYRLDPENNWYPDLDDLHNKIKYNPNVVGILIINPDNPTGMVYPESYLKRMVDLAREYNLILISDEIYANLCFGEEKTCSLAKVIKEVPGIALKGISKELPWPGARCGWMEFYNRHSNPEFDRFCAALEDAKMVEVCSTTLPQKAIPLILSDERYQSYLDERNDNIARKNRRLAEIFGDMSEVIFVPSNGAFYNTIVFKSEAINPDQSPDVTDEQVASILKNWLSKNLKPDQRFVYTMLATKGICVVPLSSFHSELNGFRITLLEEDEQRFELIFQGIKDAIITYCTPKAMME